MYISILSLFDIWTEDLSTASLLKLLSLLISCGSKESLSTLQTIIAWSSPTGKSPTAALVTIPKLDCLNKPLKLGPTPTELRCPARAFP